MLQFNFTVGEDTTDNLVFEIEFNDIIVAGVLSELAQAGQPSNLINLVIPRLQKLKLQVLILQVPRQNEKVIVS